MNNLSFLSEIFNGYNVNILDLLTILAILCGILVINTSNPILSVLFLIGLFLNIAAYLMIVGLHFIGLSYLLVYVGAVSILFLFILMLLNVRVIELLYTTEGSIVLAIVSSFFFNFPVYNMLPSSLTEAIENDISPSTFFVSLMKFYDILMAWFTGNTVEKSNNLVFQVVSPSWDGSLFEASHITGIGSIMYTSHSIWLILTSIILLLAMVGAIVITIKQK